MARPPEGLKDAEARVTELERELRRAHRLLALGQELTTIATEGAWQDSLACLLLHALQVPWLACALAEEDVDRITLWRRVERTPAVAIRPRGFLRRTCGEHWQRATPTRLDAPPFLPTREACWFLPVLAGQRCMGAICLPPEGLVGSDEHAQDLLATLVHQVATTADLATLHAKVVATATFDRTTQTLMRGAWLEAVERRLSLPADDDLEAVAMIADLDHFKAINDHLGHLAGDEYLETCTTALRVVLRSEDLLGRFGGDEFVFWLEGYPHDRVEALCERLLRQVARAAGPFQERLPGDAPSLGVTLGAAPVRFVTPPAVSEVLNAADRALYRAKAAGRGTWVVAEPLGAAEPLAAPPEPAPGGPVPGRPTPLGREPGQGTV